MTSRTDRLESRFGRDVVMQCNHVQNEREGEKIASAERTVRHGGYCGLGGIGKGKLCIDDGCGR